MGRRNITRNSTAPCSRGAPLGVRRSSVQACSCAFTIYGTHASRSLAESQASEHTHMAISGHVSRKMIEHYSHIRMDAKRTATDAIVDSGVNQNVNHLAAGDSKASAKSLMSDLRHR
jgi:hypothetical protein